MRERLRLGLATPVFALLPGSRLSELEMHASLVIGAAMRIAKARSDARFLVPLVSRATRGAFEHALWREGADPSAFTLLYGHANDALKAADVGLVASGTATLEAALARCPHVVFYRVAPLTARIVRRKLLVPWVALPNVLAGRKVVPELLQQQAAPENIADTLLRLVYDKEALAEVKREFSGIHERLRQNTAEKAAATILALLKS